MTPLNGWLQEQIWRQLLALHNPPIETKFLDENGYVTRPWAEWLYIAKRDKANRIEDATENLILVADDEGNPKESTSSVSDITTLIGAPFAELSSTKIIAYDSASGVLQEIDLNDWVDGTTNEITVTDDGDGTVTLSGAGDDTDFTVVTAIQAGGAGGIGFQYKTRALTLNGGIISTVGAESGWNDI